MQGIKFSFDDQCSNDRSSTTKGVNFIFSSFPESFRATQTIPDLASCRFIRNDTSFRVLTISCWRPVNIPPWWRTSHISFANHGQPIVVESLIPSNCPTTRVWAQWFFYLSDLDFTRAEWVGHGFRAFCVILFFWGLFVWRDLGGGQFSNDSSRSSPN